MNWLKSKWLKWVVGVLVLLALAVYIASKVLMPKHAAPEQQRAAMQAQAQLTGAAKIYAATCAYCHDAKIAPVLRGRGLPSQVISVFVRHGAGAMPAFLPSQISDAELAELADYVSKLPAVEGK